MTADAVAGAEVLRLRTRQGAETRGHALLIGAPSSGLGGVDRCLGLVRTWLEPEYERVGEPQYSTKRAIASAMAQLCGEVRRGDQVLVYYAGHGQQVLPRASVHDRPVTLWPTMPGEKDEPPRGRFVTGEELVGWLRGLALACGADPRAPFAATQGEGPSPSVTLILDCCHAAGLLDEWPRSVAGQDAILTQAADAYLDSATRGVEPPAPGVLWVLASGRDEIARGPSSGEVGLMTHALVEVLREHPGEPWWALMDRLRAGWNQPTQSPALVGPVEVVPRLGLRMKRPQGWRPCAWLGVVEGVQRWRVELAHAEGWRHGQRVALSSSLEVPRSAEGVVVPTEGGGLELRVSEAGAGGLGASRFAWAYRLELARAARVEVWGGTPLRRGRVIDALEGRVGEVRDLGSGARAQPKDAPLGLAVHGDAVAVHDRWGDAVACTSLDDLDPCMPWIERLVAIDDWLAADRSAAGWLAEAFELHWGTWAEDGEAIEWDEGPRVLSSQTPLWVEVKDRGRGRPAYAGVFRVRADRSVEVLSRRGAGGGLPVTGRYRHAAVGERSRSDEPLRLTWPAKVDGDGPRWEQLVAMVSDQPLTLALLERRPVQAGWRQEAVERREGRRQARVVMFVRRYQLRR